MKKIFTLVLATIVVMSISAQMRIWVNGNVDYEIDIASIDSITFVKNTITPDPEDPEIPAGPSKAFTVNAEGKQVRFAPGNLQFKPSARLWRFAEHQWDYCDGASDVDNFSPTYEGWIDLFGWGTSGYDNTANDPFAVNYQPWSKGGTINMEYETIIDGENVILKSADLNVHGYGPSLNQEDVDLVGTSANYDWGVYNAISNGGNMPNQWRTLTYDEWNYLLYYRKQNSAQAIVNNVRGWVLLPDDWEDPEDITLKQYEENQYTSEQWQTMEDLGAVFLPYSKYPDNSRGYYWSSTHDQASAATSFYFVNKSVSRYSPAPRQLRMAVRLVQDVK